MSKGKERTVADRRDFLKLAGLGAATGAFALATGSKEPKAEEAKAGRSLYRETDHVKKYYELARF